MTLISATADTSRGDAPRADLPSTPSFSDGLGDRLLMFDHGTATSLEVLRFKQEFSDSPAFRAALSARVEKLSSLRHPGIATVRRVGGLNQGERLTLVSKHTAGRRLSDLLDKASGPVFALELIRNVTAALAALHGAGPGIAHGALTAERIVVTREGLVLVDHVVGSALQALQLPADRLRSEFGLIAADGAPAPLDTRADVLQLGYLALSLLLGRRLNPSEDTDIAALLDEFIDAHAVGAPKASRLRRWLERALQVGSHPFDSAYSAELALSEVPDEIESEIPRTPRAADAPRTSDRPHDTAALDTNMPATHAVPHPAAIEPDEPARRRVAISRVTVSLAIVSIAEAVVIAGMLGTRQPPMVVQLRPPVIAPVAQGALPVPQADARPDAPPVSTPPVDLATAASADRPAEASGRFGGISVSSTIDLRVLEKGVVLGSTAGPIAIADGTHQLDLVNEELGFTAHQSVAVKAGQMTPVKIAVPNGRISINAVPWADVWIDGKAAGQTPLANLSIAIGKHDIVLKHPQLGEQHQTAVVKVEGQTRVSASFQK